ncbi:hypothetical protein rv5_gp192 [Escherichia phage V5]|uniref:Uncharacterized protein n=1 Tax=Escherichia phage V5 TaxID=399183 RepID=B3RGY1_9CAUD|nr:hypothetical protein rv5_gp192 [Escherichia phage V5]ABI79262.1 hypothetical protein [Escherichia phage V5]
MTLRLSPWLEKAMAGALEHKEEYEKWWLTWRGRGWRILPKK